MIKEVTSVVFSGGCYGGKTTTLEHVAGILRARKENVIVLGELMRSSNIVSIDDIRSKPSEYLKLQENIVRQKIEYENVMFESQERAIVLIDRSIADSLFYLMFYVDANKLTDAELVTYSNLLLDAQSHLKFAYNHFYDYVCFFAPLAVGKEPGIYRPKSLHVLKAIESDFITLINNAYKHEFRGLKYEHVNLNKQKMVDVAAEISSWII